MSSPVETAVGHLGLHGRDVELRWLTAALGTARRGAGVLLVVEGAAGTGKSRLIQEARVRARAGGALVLATRALPSDRGPALGVLGRLCELAARAGGAAGDDLERALAHEDPNAFVRVVARLAERTPVVVAVDDADRCDRFSLQTIAALALALDDVGGVALMLARRHAAPGCADAATADTIFADPGAVRIRLGALTAGAAAALVADALHRAPAGEFVAAVLERTGANPCLLSELALAARERGIEPTAAGVRALDDLALPAVSRALFARVAPLGDGAGELLGALAVLGDDASAAVAAALTERAPERVADLCTAFAGADVLASCDPPRFAQPLLRAALLGSLPPRERQRLHAAAARALAPTAAPDRVAGHLLASPPAGDAWTARRLRDAALSSRAHGRTEQAAAYLQRAIAEGVGELECELSRALGEATAALGDARASAHLERALEQTGEPRERAHIGLAVARLALATGAGNAARRACETALGELGAGEGDLRSRLQAELLSATHADRASADAAVDRWARGSSGPGSRLVLALGAAAAAHAGEARGAADLARRALEGGSLFEEEGSLLPHRAVDALAAADCLDEAGALYDFALARARERGSTFAAAAVLARRAPVRLRLGDVQGAIADARAALAAAPLGGSAAVCAPAVGALAAALIESDDLDAALRLVDDASLPASSFARARVHLARGCFAAALCEIDAAASTLPVNPAMAPWRSLAALCHLGLGDDDRARALATQELALARRFGAPGPVARALCVLGRTETAVEHCREAVEQLAGSSALLERGHVLVDLGTALRARGRRREAREVLRDGMQIAHRCGATRLAARARDELVAAGARPRRPVHRGVDGLTRGERRVAELAAAGLTNREIGGELFVTINTVGAHLASVYRKLGISSRAQLPVLLGEAA